MTVSAIIPTLGKRPEMLQEAIDSIKNQALPVHETIVMSDLDESFGNQARKLNEGIRKSTGEFYFFMGDDDRLQPDFVERIMQEFGRYPNLDIVTSRFNVFGEETGTHSPRGFPLCSTIVRRSMFDKVGGFDEKAPIGIDADLYFACFEAGAKWTIIPDVLYDSRVHKGQYSHYGSWDGYKEYIHQKYEGKYDNL